MRKIRMKNQLQSWRRRWPLGKKLWNGSTAPAAALSGLCTCMSSAAQRSTWSCISCCSTSIWYVVACRCSACRCSTRSAASCTSRWSSSTKAWATAEMTGRLPTKSAPICTCGAFEHFEGLISAFCGSNCSRCDELSARLWQVERGKLEKQFECSSEISAYNKQCNKKKLINFARNF